MKIIHTDSTNANFIALVKKLDAYLSVQDGEEHDFYAQYNKIDVIKHVVVVYENDIAVGCGALKPYSPNTVEIKRMYVLPSARKKGIATRILIALETWAQGLFFEKCILETGVKQPEAIALYKRNNYKITPNYGQYKDAANSICFEKKLYF